MVLPSAANFAPMKEPAAVPSFIGLNRTVTTSPGLNVVLRQPWRDSEFGLPPSRLHSVFLPFVVDDDLEPDVRIGPLQLFDRALSSTTFSSSNIAAE